MNGLAIVLIGIVALGAGYLFYGRCCKEMGNRPKCKNPAYTHEDGEDYVPSSKFYRILTSVFFHRRCRSCHRSDPLHLVFGWVPVLLWVIIGGLFFGAVQDFGALYASVKMKVNPWV